ncbi:MAG TPA: phosphoenolpyruvate synthase [Candidatus Saccharimonadales bacterium]|nr:phosphoenolpyruvate synthase [Candidatus Saccharimonadales bacterium]
MDNKDTQFILWFDQITKNDIPLVGGKNANLGEMYQNLTNATSAVFPDEKITVPFGFAVTAYAYKYFIEKNGLDVKIKALLDGLDVKDMKQLEIVGTKIRDSIIASSFPSDLEVAITTAYQNLAKRFNIQSNELDVAVRSSATAEDLPDASFAGQQESYLNIRGEHALLEAIKKAIASLFTNRAISYRVDQHFDHFQIALSVAVQKMARSDRGASGVMFTLDTDTGFRDVVLINGSWGLGEFVVKGIVTPDEFMVFKPTLKKGFRSLISKKLGTKEKKLIYATEGTNPTKEVAVAVNERQTLVLTEDQILRLAKWGCIIEDHYQKPMDIEWAYDMQENQLYIVQARPETVQSRKNSTILEEYVLLEQGNILATGAAVGSKIGQGKAHFLKDPSQLSEFQKGEVLLAEMTDPDWEPIMKLAGAIVTNQGGRTSHAAIVSRELGIPAIVGTGDVTKVVKTGQDITVCCSEGEGGKIYEGLLKFQVNKTDLTDFHLPRTEIKMIVADPELVFNYSFIPNKGVGLAREEFIISNFIKIHPNALLNYDSLQNQEVKKQIDELTKGHPDKVGYYVEKLAYGIAIIAAAFYPNEVLLRFSDFKSNEYSGLIGGKEFEPHEENPMIGWRGASRYYDPQFSSAFALECQAIKKVRNEMGLYNLQVMIPFCRTPEEGQKVIAEMAKNGLSHDKAKNLQNTVIPDENLHVWVMAEIPSNILLVEDFAEIFDGFSIGSNDLTQLTLGLDRDSKLIAHIGNENNKAVHKLIHELIQKAHEKGLKVGICGQGPSDFPELAEFLVKEGIDSISLNPDTVLKTAVRIKEVEEA